VVELSVRTNVAATTTEEAAATRVSAGAGRSAGPLDGVRDVRVRATVDRPVARTRPSLRRPPRAARPRGHTAPRPSRWTPCLSVSLRVRSSRLR